MIKRLLIAFLSLNLLSYPVLALNFDLSADEEIRKQYKPSKLEEDVGLPPMPKIDNLQNIPTQTKTKPTQTGIKPAYSVHTTQSTTNQVTNQTQSALPKIQTDINQNYSTGNG